MHATPRLYLTRNLNTTKNLTYDQWKSKAQDAWNEAGLLHVTERVQLDLARVFAIRTDSKSVGSAWHSLTPKSGDPVLWSKAMVVYLNSTLGAIAMLGSRTFKKLPYPRWGVDNIRQIPVPILNAKITKTLAATYDKYADQDIGLFMRPTSVRGALDEAVGRALGVSGDLISYTRLELSKEPMITGKRYDGGTFD